MAWNGTKTWAASDTLTAADLNTYLRDNTDALAAPASCSLAKTGTAIADSTVFTVTFTSALNELWDPNNMHSTSSNPTRITVPTGWGGKQVVMLDARFSSDPGGRRLYNLVMNGATSVASDDTGDTGAGSGDSHKSIVVTLSAAAGDYFECGGYGTSLAGGNTFDVLSFSVTWRRT